MSLTPAKMKFLDLVILDRDARRITTALGRMGVLELVKVRPETASDQAALPDRSPELDQCRALASRLDEVRERVGLGELPASPESSYEPLDAVEHEVVRLEGRIKPLLEERTKMESESERIQDELVRFDMLSAVMVPLSQVLESPFLHFAVGSIKATDLAKLQATAGQDTILLSGETDGERRNLVAVSSRKRQAELETQLRQHNFVTEDISPLAGGAPATTLDGMRKRVEQIRSEQERISQELKEVARTEAQKIASLERSLALELALVEASLNFSRTESTCRISGWLPTDQAAPTSSRLLQETEGRLFLQMREPKETDVSPDDVPVLMKDNPFIRPFQLLVTGFGFPRYREIQPTPMVAISFLTMYGLMFGDVGQGAVLALGGFVTRKRARNPQIRDLGTIICFAGIAATACGFLYGSVFGKELLRPLWIRPMEEVVTILEIPVALGVLLISIGILLNIINKFRRGDYYGGIVDRLGIVGIVLYWGAIGLGLRCIVMGPPAHILLLIALLILLPLVLLFLRELIYELFVHKGHESDGPIIALMNGGVEVMETLTGFLANTVSFARVGAFALAHAGLCLAVYSLQAVVRDLPAGIVWSGIIIVLGNVLVILLEGLVAFVQCLRLEYYEFFSKFFGGDGKRYKPFRIG
jgi:V/A-type H+-transporting ATPase subunit I